MDILKIILQWGIPVICTGIFTFISQKLKENDKSNEAIRLAMISLLRSQITSKVEKYTEMGYLPDYARYCLTDLLKQYQALGGNKKYKRVPLLNEQWHFPNDYELKKIYLIPLKDNIQNKGYLFNKREKLIILPAMLGNDAGIIGSQL